MPLIKVGIYKGKSEAHCQAILDGIHSALVDTLGIRDYNIIQELNEFPMENWSVRDGLPADETGVREK